ncbi:MAG: DNA polymerase I [Candidatus Uhrbacteria bacterium]
MTNVNEWPTLLLIDGHAILHRAFHALPPMNTPDGRMVNAAYGFTTILLKVITDYAPTHVAVTFDTGETTFRHEEYKEYKGTREEQPNELYDQIGPIEDILEAFHIPTYALDGYEADDVIGTIAERAKDLARVLILTGDLDTLQLVDDRVHVLALTTSMSQPTEYDPAAVRARFGLDPVQLIDYKTLAGDPSDNIPGVTGVGKKTATQILQAHGTLTRAVAAAKKGDAEGMTPRIAQKLLDSEDAITLGEKLVTIIRDVPITFQLADATRQPVDRERAVAVFRDLGFMSLVKRLPEKEVLPNEEEKVHSDAGGGQNNLFQASEKLQEGTFISSSKEVTQLAKILAEAQAFTFAVDEVAGLAIATGEHADSGYGTTIPWKHSAPLAPIFALDMVAKTTHDAKTAIHLLAQHDIALAGNCDDTMLMSYLLAPGTRKHDLESIAFADLGIELADNLTAHVHAIAQLAPLLRSRLVDEQLDRVYADIELPSMPVLARMEAHGILLDTDALASLSTQMHEQLDIADAHIYELAGEDFNIDSPLQLKHILFEVLGITVRGIKKTAKGGKLSTAASELEKLRDAHPIIEHVFAHRELKKLLSTYVDALPKLVGDDGRLHTTFNQVITATGRLSSSDPNLQNIPASDLWGPAIRSAFVAERGWKLLAIDYSQFELRIAATLSGDHILQQAFRNGDDIHAATAAGVFAVAPEDVTKDQRRVAKAINFGILYGMGATALAATTNTNRREAVDYIDRYFQTYPELHAWIEETKAVARKRGYVETLFGRKRYLPEITSGVHMVQAAAERMAVNMPIQGTQADLVKMAMIAADKWVRAVDPAPSIARSASSERIRMLLQVHDELVFEVRTDFVQEATRELTNILENIHTLPVPIVVDAKIGDSWGSLSPSPPAGRGG